MAASRKTCRFVRTTAGGGGRQIASWQEFGELLNPYVGWMVHLRLGEENEASVLERRDPGRVGARPPAAAEERAAVSPGHKAEAAIPPLTACILSSPTEWALSHRVD